MYEDNIVRIYTYDNEVLQVATFKGCYSESYDSLISKIYEGLHVPITLFDETDVSSVRVVYNV